MGHRCSRGESKDDEDNYIQGRTSKLQRKKASAQAVSAAPTEAEEAVPAPEAVPAVSIARRRWRLALQRIRCIAVVAERFREIRAERTERRAHEAQFGALSMAHLVHLARVRGLLQLKVYVQINRIQLIQMLVARTRGELLPDLGQEHNRKGLQRSSTWRSGDTEKQPLAAAAEGLCVDHQDPVEHADESDENARITLPPRVSISRPKGLQRWSSTPARTTSDSALSSVSQSNMQTNYFHMLEEVPLLCAAVDMGDTKATALVAVYEDHLSLFTADVLDMWRGSKEAHLFDNAAAVREKLQSVIDYGVSAACSGQL